MRTPKNATIFEFVGRAWEEGSPELSFSYRVHFEDAEPLDFIERITLGSVDWARQLKRDFIEGIMDDLLIVLGISYYKLFLPKVFQVPRALGASEAVFFNTLYRKGLGEFLYRNGLSFNELALFSGSEGVKRKPAVLETSAEKVLVGIGGGKDSIVSLHLLKDYDRTGFEVATTRRSRIVEEVANIADVPLTVIDRKLDPQVLVGITGSYSGHVPVSAVYAFLGVLEAAVKGIGYFVVSNEHSSNFGNVMHEGEEVNHKWSGSAEFESLFSDYIRSSLTPSVRYFSLTRPFYELRIVRHFTEIGEKYFHTFSSCNRNFAHDHDGETRWCGVCPKCAFAFLSLSAFLPREVLMSIFNKDLFEDEELIPLFKDLLGFGTMKPFDCVGTFEESRVALSLAAERCGNTRVVRELLPLTKNETLSTEIFKAQKATTVPSSFRLLGMGSVLILGYGKEGKTSELYIKDKFPDLRVGVADQKDGEDYLDRQHEYDVVVRTPVIPSTLVIRQSITATQLFFTEVGRQSIIGVTGSKGKSTTSTLIYLMLKEAGKKVRLVGNIGVPALLSIMEHKKEEDEIFVFELSSYQLEDLDVSPHIAVLTSLFPEHLDHHGSLEAYYEAKRSIIAFQTSEDRFACSPELSLPKAWVETVCGERMQTHLLPFEITNSSLRGVHNLQNAILAYTVASEFGVSAAEAQNVITHYKGLPHRLQHVGTFKGIEFYDDSISTTPESAIAGIRAIGNVDTIILGGVDRGYDFTLLEKEIREHGIRNVILFPESGEHMFSSEEGLTVLHTSSMEEAVAFAYEHTASGKACLLSPSAPSYNLFTNFEARGEAFADAINTHGKT